MINELDHISAEFVFSKLGIKYEVRGNELVSSCPFHEDKTPSFFFNRIKKIGVCFGCGKSVNLWSLVKELTGQSLIKFLDIKEYSKTKIAYNQSLAKFKSKKEKALKKIKEEAKSFEEFEIIAKKENPLEVPIAKDYCVSRNITQEDISKYEIFYIEDGYVGDTRYKKRLVIPIRNNKGIIVAYEGRDVTRKDKKKCIYNYGSKIGSTIFNWDKIDYSKRIIWVEGILDVLQVEKALPQEQVSSFFGIQLTNKQKDIVKLFNETILMLDSDSGGERGINNITEFLDDQFFVAKLEFGDPNENTYSMIQKAFNNRVPSTKYYLEKYDILQDKNINFLDSLNIVRKKGASY